MHGSFTCCCCGHDQYITIGSHLLTMKTDHSLFENFPEASRPLVSCTNCSHVVVHPIPSQKDIPKFYENLDYWHHQGIATNLAEGTWLEHLTYNAGHWERYLRARNHLRLIRNHSNLSADAKIIDIGSGFSPFLFHCRQQGFKNLYALEPAKEVCRFLEGQGITTYPTLLETFITRQDVPRFDGMVLSQTLEHIVSPDLVLQRLRNLLSDQGILLISVPDMEHLRPHIAGLHLHFFNERSMAHLLTKCGYRTILLQVNELKSLDRIVVKTLQYIYKKRCAGKRVTAKSVLENPWIHYFHQFCWRPAKRMLRLKTNIFISYKDVLALVRR